MNKTSASSLSKKFLASSNLKKIRSLVPELKYIYTDVDGTLLGPGGCLFYDENYKLTMKAASAIVKCHRRSVDIVMVSGRNRKQLNADGRMLGFSNFIAELGTQICYDLGESVVVNHGKKAPSKNGLLQDVKDSGAVEELFSKYKGRLEHHTPWSNDRECTFVFRGFIDIKKANKYLKGLGYKDLVVIDNGIIFGRDYEDLPQLPELHAYHLIQKGVSKASGVKMDMKIRKIEKKHTIAIGDALSDLSFASEVGALFLVSNAVTNTHDWEDILLKYDNVFVTDRSFGSGWAETVDLFL